MSEISDSMGVAEAVCLLDEDPARRARMEAALRWGGGVQSACVRVATGRQGLLRELARGDVGLVLVAGGESATASELLRVVQLRYPETIRIVVSDEAPAQALSKVPFAHQFVRSDISGPALQEEVQRCLRLRQLIPREEIRRIVSASNRLPALPALYSRLVDLLADPRCSMMKVAEVIERDVAMTARLLQIISSAFFGLSGQQTSVGACVAYLGLDTIRSLVLAGEIAQGFPVKVKNFSVETVQARALETSRLARRLATEQGLGGNHAFIAGLLHPVGELVLASRMPRAFERCLRQIHEEKLPKDEVEREVFGCTSAQVAAYLLGLWGQPLDVVFAIAAQDHPELAHVSRPSVATAVYLSKRLSRNPDAPLEKEPAGEGLYETYLSDIGALQALPSHRSLARRLAS